MRRPAVSTLGLAAAVAGTLVGLAGCSGASTAPVPSPPSGAPTAAASTSPSATGTPVVAGPTTSATAKTCPFVTEQFVHDTMGMRLGRTTVLRSGGRVVGCRFYALQGGSLHRSEHLPGPKQPAVEITTQRYSSASAAHNAFVTRASQGSNPTQVPLGGGVVGVCFQNDFYPADHGQDWACAVSSGPTTLLVRSVDTTGTFNTAAVTKAALRAL